jgi:hypothetical protein
MSYVRTAMDKLKEFLGERIISKASRRHKVLGPISPDSFLWDFLKEN